MPYSWKFYLLVAHLVDETGHTACNRDLPFFDNPDKSWLELTHRCKACRLHFQKYGLQVIVKEKQEGKQ